MKIAAGSQWTGDFYRAPLGEKKFIKCKKKTVSLELAVMPLSLHPYAMGIA